jgi:hypothetical protein
LSENLIIQNDDAPDVPAEPVKQVEDNNKQNQSLLISQSYYECIKEKDHLHEVEILEYEDEESEQIRESRKLIFNFPKS